MKISQMSWQAVEDYLKTDDLAVLPLGSTEQHAALSLSVDSILAETMALEAAEPLGVPVFPVVAYGLTPYFTAYPGTVSLRIGTYVALVRDILDGLRAQGFRRIFIVNGHGGNQPAGSLAIEWMADNPGTSVKFHNWWNAPETFAKVQQIDPVASHASWMENFPWTRLAGGPADATKADDRSRPDARDGPGAGPRLPRRRQHGRALPTPRRRDAGALGRRRRRDPSADAGALGMRAAAGPILIWGAGAIGGTLGAAFLRAGHEVALVDAAVDHVAAIRDGGMRIEGPVWADIVRAPAFTPEELNGRFDCIFLCVKALHTRSAVTALAPHLADGGVVVSAQNGLNEIEIAEVVGRKRTIGCFVNFGADYLEPGVVHYGGRGAVVIGEIDGARTDRVAALHGLMRSFEPDAVLTDNIWGYLWGKLIYGALLFATALTDDGIADVLDDPGARPILTRLGQEVGAVAAAEGVRTEGFDGFDPAAFRPGAPQAALHRSFDEMVAHNRRSAKSHSGIWRDLAVRKRKTEAEAQLGPIVAAGTRSGVPTPLTARLIAMVQEIESGRRHLARDNLAQLAATAEAAA